MSAQQETTACAHPSCQCRVSEGGKFGRYCSEHCKEKREQVELRCECRHAECH